MSAQRTILIAWCAVLALITTFLFAEYRYFKQRALELTELKDDYATHILALKKLIGGYQLAQQIGSTADTVIKDQKKKTCIINRELAYLKKSALAFARAENKNEILKELQDAYGEFEFNQEPSKKSNLVKKRPQPKRKRAIKNKTVSDHIQKMQREPIFFLPLEKSQFRLSSFFGPRKKPDGTWGFHKGIDMAATKGTPVKAAGSGVVVQAAFVSGYGNTIVIAHNRKFKTRYAHLSKIGVTIGQEVSTGDIIGNVGATGTVWKSRNGDGSHLHFEVYVYGEQQNPFYYLRNY